MKKIAMGLVVALASATAFADIGVSTVQDNTLDRHGVRVEADVPLGLRASVTHIDDAYTRYGVGKSFDLLKVGPVAVSAVGGAVYQSTANGRDGYGLTAGVSASMPITKSVSVTAGVERFIGQERIDQFNGNIATVGLKAKF